MEGPLLQGDALKQATRTLASELQAKIDGAQNGVGTFSDYATLELIEKLQQLDNTRPWEQSMFELAGNIEAIRLALQRLQWFLSRRGQGRFVDFTERTAASPGQSSDISNLDLIMSQGTFDCMQWKGMPLFKTVYDFSLYPMMLWALKPATVIELGSGSGASAMWLADLLAMFGIRSHAYSVDVKKPELQAAGVTFVQGDCRAIDTVFEEELLKTAPHPWMLIEDAHVNVRGVLGYFHRFLLKGDYVIVEDSAAGKQDDIGTFLAQERGSYKVDTYYTDFFGRNATCAQDSIFVRA